MTVKQCLVYTWMMGFDQGMDYDEQAIIRKPLCLMQGSRLLLNSFFFFFFARPIASNCVLHSINDYIF